MKEKWLPSQVDFSFQIQTTRVVEAMLNQSFQVKNENGKQTNSAIPMIMDQLAEMLTCVVSTPQKLITTPDPMQTLKYFLGGSNDSFCTWFSSIQVLRVQYSWGNYVTLAITRSRRWGAAMDSDDGPGQFCVMRDEWVGNTKEHFSYSPYIPDGTWDCKRQVKRIDESIFDYIYAKLKILSKCLYRLCEWNKIR